MSSQLNELINCPYWGVGMNRSAGLHVRKQQYMCACIAPQKANVFKIGMRLLLHRVVGHAFSLVVVRLCVSYAFLLSI